ncbi:uncharacterized protein LOC133317009 [Gastrolobium bilobum]|uniref:uncharacterized protein LOC133317009 n=1 Tax=Gastrolobium bilobum TaxID=150636 RepID=UPI002AB0945F|nr:uncharacterized protein LOC133317009 [Gastrolobium bilobum]
MRKASTMQCTVLVRLWVPLLLAVTFCYAEFGVATTNVSGNEVKTDGKVLKEELAKTREEVDDEKEAKLKGINHPKPTLKKPYLKKPIPLFDKKPFSKPLHIPKNKKRFSHQVTSVVESESSLMGRVPPYDLHWNRDFPHFPPNRRVPPPAPVKRLCFRLFCIPCPHHFNCCRFRRSPCNATPSRQDSSYLP